MDEPAHPARHLAIHDRRGIEVLDLGGDLHVITRRVEVADPSTAAHAGHEVPPEGRMVIADGRDGADAGHHGTARQVLAGRHGRRSSGLRTLLILAAHRGSTASSRSGSPASAMAIIAL